MTFDVKHRKVMFEVIYMQSKLAKYSKYHETWREYFEQLKRVKTYYHFRFLPHEMMRSKAQTMHARCFFFAVPNSKTQKT